ncbi:MAG: polysaccharide biosynthesis protein, partial [Anaerolineales bacterium]
PACEYNPIEAIMTNIMGGRNVIEASLDTSVEKVMALSTDKAVNPINLYGATKLAAEKLFIQSNAYAGGRDVRFSCVRYGNVVGSRGSVVPVFVKQRERGKLTVTDERMTRFWLSLEQGVDFTIRCVEQMQGGEVFVPKIPSTHITDLAKAIAPQAEIEYIGIRPGEKLHEVLISEDEARHTLEMDDMFVVEPSGALWFGHGWREEGNPLPEGFRYASDSNKEWLDQDQIRELVRPFDEVMQENLKLG